VSSVRYELGFYIAEDGILHSHRRENLKSYNSDGLHFTETAHARLHFTETAHARDAKPQAHI
jgi:hypothetical protein